MFGCLFGVFRSIASLILGLVIFFGFLGFLLISNVRDNFLSDEFYTDNIAENNAYNRIYDEVFLDPEFEDTTDDLLGDLDVSTGDIADIAREIIPPQYLQDQVEGAIERAIDYLNKETETAEVFIDLGTPLKRAKPALFRYMDRRIDQLEDMPVTTFEELEAELESLFRTLETGEIPDRVPSIEDPDALVLSYVDQTIADLEEVPVSTIEDFRKELENVYNELANGEIPTRVPSIEDPEALVTRYVDERIAELEEVPVSTTEDFRKELENVYNELADAEIPTRIPSIDVIPVSDRNAAYDLVFRAVRSNPSIPEAAKKGLEEREEEIKSQLRDGNVKGALEIASRPLIGPVIDEFVDDAYDKAFQTLSQDESFPQSALEGLAEREEEIKSKLREGSIKSALEVASPELTSPVIDEFVDDAFDRVFQTLSEDESFPQNALDGLDRQRDAIKEHLGEGEIKEALKLGARGLAGPLIDDALEELREELDDQDRLDLVAKAAEQRDQTREEFLEDVDSGRDIIDRSGVGLWLTILMMVLGVVFMATVHLPHLSSGLRWPGLTLLLTGLVFLIAGLVSKSQLLDDPLDRADVSPIPPTMVDIINDIATSMASDVAGGVITACIVVMAIGFAMLVGSFAIRLLHIPFLSR